MAWAVIGHTWAAEILQRDWAHHRLKHAYLFTGPEGVGKRTLAVQLARALVCSAPAASAPCGQCRHCQLSAKAAHPDMFTVAPTVSGQRVRAEKIKIEPIRQLIYDVALKPVEAARRVALLLRFDAANAEAQNALLKTLEEPPPNVTLLLTAARAEDLLPTIVSRCEVINLRPLPTEVVREALITRWLVNAEQAALLAALSGGRLGWAVRMHHDPAALEDRAEKLADLARLLSATRVQRFAYAEKLARNNGLDVIQDTLELWLSVWRDVLLASARAQAPLANPDRAADIRHWAARLTPETVSQTIHALRRTSELLERNVNTRLALEVMLLDWPKI